MMRVNPFLPVNAGNEAKRSRGDRGQREPGLRSPLQFDAWLQIAIVAVTVPGLYLVGDPDPGLRWAGYLVSFASQPIWLLATWRMRQYGMFFVALIYTAMWARAIYINW